MPRLKLNRYYEPFPVDAAPGTERPAGVRLAAFGPDSTEPLTGDNLELDVSIRLTSNVSPECGESGRRRANHLRASSQIFPSSTLVEKCSTLTKIRNHLPGIRLPLPLHASSLSQRHCIVVQTAESPILRASHAALDGSRSRALAASVLSSGDEMRRVGKGGRKEGGGAGTGGGGGGGHQRCAHGPSRPFPVVCQLRNFRHLYLPLLIFRIRENGRSGREPCQNHSRRTLRLSWCNRERLPSLNWSAGLLALRERGKTQIWRKGRRALRWGNVRLKASGGAASPTGRRAGPAVDLPECELLERVDGRECTQGFPRDDTEVDFGQGEVLKGWAPAR